MREIIIFSTIFAIVFILSGCDQLVYTAQLDEEAVITQDGEIVGDTKKPGLHFKFPYTQQVHFVKTVRLRKNEFFIRGHDNLQIEIVWGE